MDTSEKKNASRNLAALVDFSNLINSSLELDFILNNLLLTCFGKFYSTRGMIIILNDECKVSFIASKGINNQDIEIFNQVSTDQIEESHDIKLFCEKYKLRLKKNIILRGRTRGIVFLSEKLNKTEYSEEDQAFLDTLLNITSIAVENSLVITKLKEVNRDLDSRVNQLSTLFDLSKEFGGILDVKMIAKLLSFSIIGQLFVTKYAIVKKHKEIEILESKFDEEKLAAVCGNCRFDLITEPVNTDEYDYLKDYYELGVQLIIPMQVKNITIGLILVGKKINNLQFTKSEKEFSYALAGMAAISFENVRLFNEALEKERLEKDLELAKKIQRNLLPHSVPKFSNIEVSAINIPARQVGGDYYDLVKLDTENLLFAIGDVSGKGMQAALMMANTQAFLKSICKQKLPLDESTNLLNNLISENTTSGGFITFFWGIFNNNTKELTYVNAGHNPPLLIRNNSIEYLKKGGMILGVMETLIPYEMTKIQLQSGDLLVLFTDGITEAMSIEKEEYSDPRLEELILKNSEKNVNNLMEIIMQDVKLFTLGAEQSDDITSLIIKIN